MTAALARRLARLEPAPAPGRMVYRVFSTVADAEADIEPTLGLRWSESPLAFRGTPAGHDEHTAPSAGPA